jgi:hypothetical protein
MPLGSDDPLAAARAVRRALAAAGRRAVEVTDLVVASPEAIDPDTLARFARRALGPHGPSIATISLVSDAQDAEGLAARAAQHPMGKMAPGGVVVAVGIDERGDVVALCLGPAAGYLTGR